MLALLGCLFCFSAYDWASFLSLWVICVRSNWVMSGDMVITYFWASVFTVSWASVFETHLHPTFLSCHPTSENWPDFHPTLKFQIRLCKSVSDFWLLYPTLRKLFRLLNSQSDFTVSVSDLPKLVPTFISYDPTYISVWDIPMNSHPGPYPGPHARPRMRINFFSHVNSL